MPNRIIKESICTSEDINSLSPEAETLFYRLIVKADDFGCYHGNIKIVKSTCYPLKADAIKDKQIADWLNELIKAGLIFIYTADDGKRYIKLAKWEKHQQKRATKPKFPLPKSSDINCNQVNANVPVIEISNRESIYENENANANTRKPEKIKFADFVSLTNVEYDALVAKLGEEGTKRCIEILDNYKGSTGKKYKSDYRTILNWVVQRYEEEQQKNKNKAGNKAEFKPKEIYL